MNPPTQNAYDSDLWCESYTALRAQYRAAIDDPESFFMFLHGPDSPPQTAPSSYAQAQLEPNIVHDHAFLQRRFTLHADYGIRDLLRFMGIRNFFLKLAYESNIK